MQYQIRVGDLVQVNRDGHFFYAQVVDIIPSNDFRPAQYRVKSINAINAPTLTPNPGEMWVDANKAVSYDALRYAFGPIDEIENLKKAGSI